jgi:alkylation response protein AidB-like acyl-CoA dehydrogenase
MALGAEHDTERIARLAAEVERRFGSFVHEWVNPGADGRDRTGEPLPRALLGEAGRLGLLGFSLPPEVGGQGRDKFEWGIVLEEVSRISRDAGLSPVVDVNAGVAEVLIQTGRSELIERYAVRMAAGLLVCPPAAYEGRDPFEYATTAREVAGGWRLDGSKPFIGGALFADAFLVYAREEESGDILSFVVERGDEGVCVDRLPTTGLRSMGFGALSMAGVRLPRERMVAGVDALSTMNTYLRNRRLMTACSVVGHMRALFDTCVLALDGRQRGGRSVLELPNVQRTVGEMYTAVHASRAMVHRALATTYGQRDQFFDPVSTVAKEFAAEQVIKVGLAVMDLQGGEGYMRSHPWERYVRDALGLIGGQGAQELLLIQLGQHATSEVKQRQVRMEKAQQTISELTEGWWAFTVLASALESGLLDELRTPATAGEAACRLGAPPRLVGEMLQVLVTTGLVRRQGERFAVSDGLETILTAGPVRAATASEARSTMLQGDRFFDRSRRRALAVGWHDHEPDLLEAQGGPSPVLGEILLGRLAQRLDGLDERLNRPDACLLDVGTGSARIAVEMCRRLPTAHVVGIDPMAEAIAVAERVVAEAGLADRIELRTQGVEALEDADRFDLAWVPAGFLPPAALRSGLRAVLRSLRIGGWALLFTQSVPGTDLRSSVSRFQNVRWAGHALLPDELVGMMEEAGFGPVRLVTEPLGGTLHFVAGRRVRVGPPG